MRKIPFLTASLALAAVASAQTTAMTTTALDVTLGANANLRQIGLLQEAYHTYRDGTDGNQSDNLGGSLTLGGSSSTSHGGDGLTTFSATSTATSTLDSPDYSAVPAGGPGYDNRFQGYRYYLTLKNLTTVDQTVSFHVKLDISGSGSAASPYGLAQFDGNGSPTHAGAYAYSGFDAGVIDESTGDATNPLYEVGSFDATNFYGSGVASPSYDVSHYIVEYDATYTLPSTQIHTFELFTTSTGQTAFVPVPEPAPIAALAIGALALLRRRARKA